MKINYKKEIDDLHSYLTELREIKDHFYVSHNNMFMHKADQERFHQIVIEVTDLLYDLLGKNEYSTSILSAYHEGINNFSKTPSLHSVNQIDSCISAFITRIKRNPDYIAKSNLSSVEAKPLQLPDEDKITFAWLYHHVPIAFWIWFVGIMFSAFILGANIALNSQTVHELRGISCVSKSQPNPNSR